MKLGVPWSVKGIRPEARETAREAARRSGMSLGDWLNSVILQQAAEGGFHDDDDEDDSYGGELEAVHQRLDDLTRRIEGFTRSGPAAFAPKRSRDEAGQIAELIGRLDRRLDQLVSTHAMPQPAPHGAGYAGGQPPLDRAVAEIAARQRALNAGPNAAAPAARHTIAPQPAAIASPALAPVPTQDLSGLEEQLRKITDQIETLRRPGVEEAIHALRGELAEIGRALNDAMPRRVIESIENQIAGLSQRIAEGRQSGVDARALAGVEQGLAEVRDALRGLTPAESLVGFNDAVQALSHRIDLIVAQKNPATLHQLENAITTLREMAAHVASDEAVGSLAAQVRTLAGRVEELGGGGVGGDAINNLGHRIEALSRALAERAQTGSSVPPRLEMLVESLTDKIEQIQHSRGDNVAIGHLEDRIVSLVERLDASDSRLSHLEAIERGLGDLLVHIQDIQAGRATDSLRAEDTAGVHAIKHDLARTQTAIEAVNGTLGHVVDRLAMIEKGFSQAKMAQPRPSPLSAPMPSPPLAPDDDDTLELTEPVGRIAVRAVEDTPRMPPATPLNVPPAAATVAPPPPQPPRRMPPANLGPIDPDLPPDQPLEPGSGPPRQRAGARIAASEAALGHARPATMEGGKSSFIAAARRAAQAAMQEASARMPPPASPATPEFYSEEPAPSSFRGIVRKRMKSLLVAASIVALVVGAVQIIGSTVHTGPAKIAPANVSTTEGPEADEDNAAEVVRPQPPRVVPAVPAPHGNLMAPSSLPAIGQAAPAAPSLLSPPALNPPPAPPPSNDVTGSLPKNAPAAASGRSPAPAPGADRLPIAIGSARLREAAIHGDAAAAYEIGARFAEGRGVPASNEEAARWYERAASKGLAMAQFRYATLLEKGQGVKKDLRHARQLYVAAANQGNAKAMHNLAVLYAEGVEGRPDYATAAQWFRKAAQRGLADSQYNLGVLCARGLGIEKNLTESYKWFALASAQGDKEADRKRDDVASQLDARALGAANHAVKTFAAEAQPHEATTVPVPPGGWDDTPAQTRARTAKPLALGAYNVGKR